MKKALITFIVLFVISLFTAIVSLAICGGELIKVGVAYGKEAYQEYKEQEAQNDVMAKIELPNM